MNQAASFTVTRDLMLHKWNHLAMSMFMQSNFFFWSKTPKNLLWIKELFWLPFWTLFGLIVCIVLSAQLCILVIIDIYICYIVFQCSLQMLYIFCLNWPHLWSVQLEIDFVFSVFILKCITEICSNKLTSVADHSTW